MNVAASASGATTPLHRHPPYDAGHPAIPHGHGLVAFGAMKRRFLDLLDGPRATPVAVLLALLLCLPIFGYGFLADDWFQRAIILGWMGEIDLPLFVGDPARNPLWYQFDFFTSEPGSGRDLVELGLLPWWAAPNIQASFLRPLAATSHLMDYALWPDSPAMMHVHGLLWLALCVLGVSALLRRFGRDPRVAGLGVLLFAFQDHHAGPVLWIANRNALIALALSSAALLLHDGWRRGGHRLQGLLAPLVLGLGLLAGEAALATCGFLLAYALCLDRASWPRRLASLLTYAPVLLGWAAWYVLGGYGTAGAQSYVSPLSADFAVAVVERVPVLLGALWAKLPADAWIAIPRSGQLVLLGSSIAVVVVLSWLLLPVLRHRAEARFWALAMVLAALPICASFPMDRLLLFMGVAGAGLLAEAVGQSGWLGGPMVGSLPRRWGIGGLLLLHLGFAPLLLPVKIFAFGTAFSVFERAAGYAPTDPALEEQQLVWVNGATLFSGFVPVLRALNDDPSPRGQWTLAHMMTDMDLERVDARTIVATAPAGFLATPPEQLVRDVRIPFDTGVRKDHAGLGVTVLECVPDGRPRVVRFDFPTDLDDPELRWVVWEDTELHPWEVPAVGETVHVEPSWPPFLP